MASRALQHIAAARIFISSSNEAEALELRKIVRRIVDSVNEDLDSEGRRLTLKLVEWQAYTPTQLPNTTITDMFATEATGSDAVVALLVRELRPGTEAEIEAVRVLDSDDVALHTLVFPPDDDWMALDEKLRNYLEDHADHLLYKVLGDWAKPPAEQGLQKTVTRIAFRFLQDPVEAPLPYTELRGA